MSSFAPRWTTPPGATALDLLRERGLSVRLLIEDYQHNLSEVSRLLSGVTPLTAEWAGRLSRVLGGSPAFWLKRESNYRADLDRLCGEAIAAAEDWVTHLPLSELVQLGWIEEGNTPRETTVSACAFLGVASGEAYHRKYQRLMSGTAYRSSSRFATNASTLAAWLRQGEIEALAAECAEWNPNRLSETLSQIRTLTREHDPQVFVPELRRMLAACGVALAIVRAPDGCRASGATRFVSPHKPLMQLSFRYLADDQFWFTVFHEIGHLLLHSNEELFLEGAADRNSEAEAQANDFAVQSLLENVGSAAIDNLTISKFEIARLARRAGVAPGIIVGQLQKRKRIHFKQFNYLKVRYSWGE